MNADDNLEEVSKSTEPNVPPAAASAAAPPRRRLTFGIASVIAVTVVLAWNFAAIREAPGLGLLTLITTAPACVHACLTAERSRAKGEPVRFDVVLRVFFISLTVIALGWVCAVPAFCVACTAGALVFESVIPPSSAPRALGVVGPRDLALGVGVALGLTASAPLMYLVARALWRRSEKQ